MALPALRYQLQLSQPLVSSLTYVNVGERATLTFIVANPGAEVTLTSLSFVFPAFGQAASDLAPSARDVTPALPTGWEIVAGTAFTVRPTSGSAKIGTAPLTFVFLVTVNATAGVADIGVTEVTTKGTAFLATPFAVTKMPSDFVLANLQATPASIVPEDTVTLTWKGTPRQPYLVGHPDGTATVIAPSSGSASWTSGPVRTTYPSVTFTVSASRQQSGSALSAEASTSVRVDVPQVIAFPQPEAPFFSRPAFLTWQTQNADYCKLFENGRLLNDRAPASAPAPGYTVTPRNRSTTYQLYAVKGRATVSAQPVIVTLYSWTTRTVSVETTKSTFPELALALSPDAATLYYGGDTGIFVINAATGAVTRTVSSVRGVCRGGLAVTPDGATLYAALVTGAVVAFNTANMGAAPRPLPGVPSGSLAVSPDGRTLYVASNVQSKKNPCVLAIVRGGATSFVPMTGMWASGIAVGPDGSVYVATGSNQSNPLFRYDPATQHLTDVGRVSNAPIAIDATGSFLGVPAVARFGLYTGAVQVLTLPSGAAGPRVVIAEHTARVAVDQTHAIAADPDANLYVTVATASASRTDPVESRLGLFFVDRVSGRFAEVAANHYMGSSAVAVHPAGTSVYFAYGGTLLIATPNASRSLASDGDDVLAEDATLPAPGASTPSATSIKRL